ncbi:hypothetical protein ACPCG0_08125 [Propionibacteriaceae bacterium Y1923]
MTTPEAGAPDALDPTADPFQDHPGRGGVDDPTIWLANFLAEAEQLAAQAQAAEAAMADQSTTVENRFMRMTMGASGQITKLVFSPSANAATAAQLTEAFQELHVQAASSATRDTLKIMSTLVGPDGPSLGAIRDSVSDEVREQMALDDAAEAAGDPSGDQ